MLRVPKSSDTPKAEQMGAVGVVTSDTRYKQMFQKLTVHPVVDEKEFPAFQNKFQEFYKNEQPRTLSAEYPFPAPRY